ncbi:MAG TPA: asparagine synthase (glutamine-hydrolyzing) [Steroidobacteraceae bacterium]|nr:asparagine synthase (glutamine-hydrolyzing) [Steroidobacteraceae bacterium]
MCGIFGIVQYGGGELPGDALIVRARDTMRHRGPDGAGLWRSPDGRAVLAHRRLSIIDLSDAAAQPMANEDGSVWVTYNGEIYNHLALRAELSQKGHRFRTDHSDTEVLVHGYEEWGALGLVRRIAGDYGFALWDGTRRSLTLVRDRTGVKPLYVAWGPGCIAFASEIKALLELPWLERDVDPLALYHYLSFLTTPAPMTMFRGVYKLPAGCMLQVDAQGAVVAQRYWDAVPGQGIPTGDVAGLDDEARERYYVEGIRERLRASVARRMISDVPFGVFLSGGVDSSTNVALMAQLMDRPVNTFTVGFRDYTHLNELDYADLVARRFGTNHHTVLIDERDMQGYLDLLIHSQDEPIADWVCIPLYFVSKLARESGTTVIQVGEGSDEQFCGYESYMAYLEMHRRYWQPFRRWLPSPLQRGMAAAFASAAQMRPSLAVYADIVDRAARGREHFWSGATAFWDMLKAQLVHKERLPHGQIPAALLDSGLFPSSYAQPDSFNVVRSFLEPFDRQHPGQDVLTRMIYNEFRLRLPELLLMRVDKIGMSVSLEARVPFLDHELVEFTMDIPMADKIRGNVPKRLLKAAVTGLIPDEIIHRKKMGFAAPMSQWLRGDFGRRVEGSILGSRLLDRGWLDRGYIRRLCAEHRSGRADQSLYIWIIYNLTAWYDYWIDPPHRAAVA